MAEAKKEFVEVSPLERQWLKKSVELQRQSLARSRSKELPASEVYELRGRELAQLDAILARL